MSHIVWDEKYSVGIEVIDEQHKKIIATVGSLLDAMQQGQTKDILADIIHAMVMYAGTHFGTGNGALGDRLSSLIFSSAT